MYKQFKDVKNIVFPVFALPSTDWYRQDGVLFIDSGKVLDDSNMPGKTLGIRRVQCGRSDLCKLRRAYITFHDMLKSGHKIFIDSAGVPFVYNRTINSPLIHHMVKRIEYKETKTLAWLTNIPYPMVLPRPPVEEVLWARVLYFKGYPWVIYDFARERGKDSYRRV